MLAAVV